MPESSDDVRHALPFSTSVIRDSEEFRKLEFEWDALLADSQQEVFFLRWHWNWLWWQHFAPTRSDLHIVRCNDRDGCLVGIAPLYRRERSVLGIPCARELAMFGTGIELKTGEYLDVFAKRGAEHAVGEAIGDCLEAQGAWDRLWLHGVPEGSAVVGNLLQRLRGYVASVACDTAPYVDTSVGWDDYKRSLGRSMRRNVDYYARRLFKKYPCEFRLVESNDDLEPAIDDLVRLHQLRWRSADEPGVFSSPTVESFLREAMRRSQAEGRLRLWTLSVDGSVQAALVGFLDNGVLHYFQKGFNPKFAADDLGTAMLSLCIRACFDDSRIRAFDFMSGGAAYKMLWARQHRVTVLHEVRRPNVRAYLHNVLGRAREMSAGVYRAATPLRIREARRDWLRRRRVRRSTRTLPRTAGLVAAVLLDQAGLLAELSLGALGFV